MEDLSSPGAIPPNLNRLLDGLNLMEWNHPLGPLRLATLAEDHRILRPHARTDCGGLGLIADVESLERGWNTSFDLDRLPCCNVLLAQSMNHEIIDDRHLAFQANEFIAAIRTTIKESLGDGLNEDIVPKGTIFEQTTPKFMLAQKPA